MFALKDFPCPLKLTSVKAMYGWCFIAQANKAENYGTVGSKFRLESP